MSSPRSPSSPAALSDTVKAAVQRVYKVSKFSKRRYSVDDLKRGSSVEDITISPKSSNLHRLQALDYFQAAELANRRLAEFKAAKMAQKNAKRGRSKSVDLSALDKLRAATDKVMVVNRIQRPMAEIGFGKAEIGKTNDLKERLLRRKSISL